MENKWGYSKEDANVLQSLVAIHQVNRNPETFQMPSLETMFSLLPGSEAIENIGVSRLLITKLKTDLIEEIDDQLEMTTNEWLEELR